MLLSMMNEINGALAIANAVEYDKMHGALAIANAVEYDAQITYTLR